MTGMGVHFPEFVAAGDQVAQRDIDQYDLVSVDNPVVSNTWFGTMAAGTNAQTKALVLINQTADWPRNALYSVVGTNDIGGTFTTNGLDQFGQYQTEVAGFGTVAAGTPAGSVFGTVIWAKILSGSFTFALGSAGNGSAQVGVGTVTSGTFQNNWFGLLSKLGGTGDVKMITWINNATTTTLNKGTALGTLVNVARHAFQGTSGVATTDHYKVIFKPSFDNTSFGTMSAL
jgi:hypothetical protein